MTALTYNLSVGIGSALAAAGVGILFGVGWACVAAGGLILANTYAALALLKG